MGDSVTEGTVLEWHKQEGDTVAEDEVLVEISTDKVDAEVPSPADWHDREDPRRRGRHDQRRRRARRDHAERQRARRRRARRRRARCRRGGATGETVDIVMPAMGESVTEGTILEWLKQPGDAVAQDETIVEVSTDKVDAEVPAPAPGTLDRDPRAGRRHRQRRPGARAHDRRERRRPRRRRRPSPPPSRQRPAAPPRRSPTASRSPRSRRASPPCDGVDLATVHGTGPAGRISKADVLAAANGAAAPARRGARSRSRAERDARALHGRVALGPDRDVVPHAHRHRARRPPQAAQGGRPARLLHPPDRLRDRARGDRADAGDGARTSRRSTASRT